MADIRDEHGNPIQLTDQHGNTVQLTDEHGNPMHLTGVAMSTTTVGSEIHGAPGSETTGVNWTGVGAREHDHQLEQQKQQQHDQGVSRSSSSSSGSGKMGEEGRRGKGENKGEINRWKEQGRAFTGRELSKYSHNHYICRPCRYSTVP
uniref:Dehydrin n=1 Tax=Fagus sylvatica TaxID=28930 RepID=A0A2N9IW50_FAGSY